MRKYLYVLVLSMVILGFSGSSVHAGEKPEAACLRLSGLPKLDSGMAGLDTGPDTVVEEDLKSLKSRRLGIAVNTVNFDFGDARPNVQILSAHVKEAVCWSVSLTLRF